MGNKIKAIINMQRKDVGKFTSCLFSKLCYALGGGKKVALIKPLLCIRHFSILDMDPLFST